MLPYSTTQDFTRLPDQNSNEAPRLFHSLFKWIQVFDIEVRSGRASTGDGQCFCWGKSMTTLRGYIATSGSSRASAKALYPIFFQISPFGPIASECCAELTILMSKVQNGLWQIGSLDNAADLDSPFFFDEFADNVQEVGRELSTEISKPRACLHHLNYIPRNTI